MASWARIKGISPIDDDLLDCVQDWQRKRAVAPPADRTWLRIACQFVDGQDEVEFLVAAPPFGGTVGELVDVEETHTLRILTPETTDHRPPRAEAIAISVERGERGWRCGCPPPPISNELFSLDEEAVTALDAFRTLSLGHGALVMGWETHSQINLTSMMQSALARAALAHVNTRDFAIWMPHGIPFEIFRVARNRKPLHCSWSPTGTLVLRDDANAELLADFHPAPSVQLPELPTWDHFGAAPADAEAIRIEKHGGLPFDALTTITSQRPSGWVTFVVDELHTLRITTEMPASEFSVEGPGFTTSGGRRNVPITVPYEVAVGLHSSSKLSPVALWADASWGILELEALPVQMVWRRPG